jgi:hypothetical protein
VIANIVIAIVAYTNTNVTDAGIGYYWMSLAK